jgi:hypothetical protein
MYTKPTVTEFGTFRELTQAGCSGMSDGRTFTGDSAAGTSVGSTPRITSGTTDYCFSPSSGSR